MSEQNEESTLPVLPLRNAVLLPQLVIPLSADRKRSVEAIEAALSREEKAVLVVGQKEASVEEPGLDDLYPFGTRGVVKRMERGDSEIQLMIFGIERVKIGESKRTDPYLEVTYEVQKPSSGKGAEVEALEREVSELAGRAASLTSPIAEASLQQAMAQVEDSLHRAYLIATILNLPPDRQQSLLSADSLVEILKRLHEILAHELKVLEVRQEISSKTQSELSQQQREHLLRQQLQTIQDELGEDSPEKADVARLRERIGEADLPESVSEQADRELRRLERMHPASPDHQLTRTYLELISELPWHKTTEDVLDLTRARRILDEDHYDLEDVKERIVEHLAVLRMNPDAKAPILCFVGPPGVGKTSLGQSIARSMDREFERLSLGGIHDESELRGHRRTYIGAMPGRIIKAIHRAGVKNPLMMLDEIDKLGRGFHGDPSAALLEILDPAQNDTFHDNYLDLAFDLSKVFFITTANTLDTIPRPLLDRMEVLRLAGYSDDEKAQIARRYLIPRQLDQAGLSEEQLRIEDSAVYYAIRRYTREAGLRQLERRIGSVCRKVTTKLLEEDTEQITVDDKKLAELLGPERFHAEDARQELDPGVAPGLAWTEAGGDVLYVEALLIPGQRELTLTGQLGDVMKESARAAHSFVLSRADGLGIPSERLEQGIHVHVPAGATPKDGPSAGVTMAVAFASLLTGKPARSDTAMTGEITLSGLVLPVGGVKEKVLAAHRTGLRRIILPKQNEGDLQDVAEHLRNKLEFIPAERIEDVISAAIPDLSLSRPTRRSGTAPIKS